MSGGEWHDWRQWIGPVLVAVVSSSTLPSELDGRQFPLSQLVVFVAAGVFHSVCQLGGRIREVDAPELV